MVETPRRQESTPMRHFVDVFTPDTLVYDSHTQDALFLLRRGIWELHDINGSEFTAHNQPDYDLRPQEVFPHAKGTGTGVLEYWEAVQAQGREPFLMVVSNIKDGVVGVLEGRKYTYAGTNEPAIFVNWVVVENSGRNDSDEYSYRGKEVGNLMYDTLEEMAREQGIGLLIAGVNAANTKAIRLHEKRGFVKEEFAGELDEKGEPHPHATEHGIFHPPYQIEDTDSEGNKVEGIIEVYSKRLR